ncbi:MAG TPA: sigma-54 dependent transcriptional regulator [Planctomycetota bacterium]|nr:sigma-54 dependent transcriptional regulator [Planctomycetota bacterium]
MTTSHTSESGRLRTIAEIPARVLVVDDDEVTCSLLEEVLAGDGYVVERATSGLEALDKHKRAPFDAVVSDVRMGEGRMTGLELLRSLRSATPDLTVVIMTAFGTMETAIEATRDGAFEFVPKPFKIEEIKVAIRRGLEQRRRAASAAPAAQPKAVDVTSIVGRSRPMLEVYKLIALVSPTPKTVLIVGETGAGKELVARAIHRNSPRAGKPFLAVNCAALPEHLLESELFGHVRGAFTGAIADKRGLFEEASGGTLFLDEIGDMSVPLQSKLLRVLQDMEVRRVGGNVGVKVDVRVIAATNRPLRQLVAEKRFREDLYYRLNVVTIEVPPLRERPSDLPLLVDHFLAKHARAVDRPVPSIAPEALEALRRYPFPGNVRELEHVLESAVTLAKRPVILLEDLAEDIRTHAPERMPTLEEVEKEHIMKVLRQTGGNRQEAAQVLGIDRTTLWRKLKQYGISEKD